MASGKAVTCKGMLKQLRRFFHSEDVSHEERARLWDVLTALRGPDSDSHSMKIATTAVIRQAAIGDPGLWVPAIFLFDSKPSAAYRRRMRRRQRRRPHFLRHAQDAFRALELDWNLENKLEDDE